MDIEERNKEFDQILKKLQYMNDGTGKESIRDPNNPNETIHINSRSAGQIQTNRQSHFSPIEEEKTCRSSNMGTGSGAFDDPTPKNINSATKKKSKFNKRANDPRLEEKSQSNAEEEVKERRRKSVLKKSKNMTFGDNVKNALKQFEG